MRSNRQGKNNSMYNRHHTKETKLKMSIAQKKRIRKPHTIETKKKMSDSKKDIPLSEKHKESISKALSGSNHYNWMGGITPLHLQIRRHDMYSDWRTKVFQRDNYTCRVCGKRGNNIEAHHINSFSFIKNKYNITTIEEAILCLELWNINNGITLCEECHTHIYNPLNIFITYIHQFLQSQEDNS